MARFRFGDLKKQEKRDAPILRGTTPVEVREVLTGQVRGKRASDDEERFARAFNKYDVSFEFQIPLRTAYSVPGEEKKLDFLLRGYQPFEPRGFIGHYRTLGQQKEDDMREHQLNDVFRKLGWRNLKWAKYTEFGETQDSVDEYVRKEIL